MVCCEGLFAGIVWVNLSHYGNCNDSEVILTDHLYLIMQYFYLEMFQDDRISSSTGHEGSLNTFMNTENGLI